MEECTQIQKLVAVEICKSIDNPVSNKIKDSEVAVFANLLWPNLEKLYIRIYFDYKAANDIGDIGANRIWETQFSKLTTLSLRNYEPK